jgi:hypothetical protein
VLAAGGAQVPLGVAVPRERIDFFVSYTEVDRVWAEWVAWQLEINGCTAWHHKSG